MRIRRETLDTAISKMAISQKSAERDRCYENRPPRQNEKKNNATDQASPRDPARREALLVLQTDRREIRCAIPKEGKDIRDVQQWPKIEEQCDDSSAEAEPQNSGFRRYLFRMPQLIREVM